MLLPAVEARGLASFDQIADHQTCPVGEQLVQLATATDVIGQRPQPEAVRASALLHVSCHDRSVETRQAFADTEVDLRRLIREMAQATSASPDAWLSWPGSPSRKLLEKRRAGDAGERVGAKVSDDLLDYTDFGDLVSLVMENWHHFSVAFVDQNETFALLRSLKRLRNPEAHSRGLLPFEQHLVYGATGRLRNEIALWRSRNYPARNYYPMLHDIFDQLGNQAPEEASNVGAPIAHRWSVGDVVTLTCRAWSPRGQALRWWLLARPGEVDAYVLDEQQVDVEAGEIATVDLSFQVTAREVGEYRFIRVFMEAVDAPYHLHGTYDGRAGIAYAVNPPSW
jgi:hypothetical protein